MCAEVNGVQEVGLGTHEHHYYVMKVIQGQVFAASNKIWQMRLVEQLAVWHVPLFKVKQ